MRYFLLTVTISKKKKSYKELKPGIPADEVQIHTTYLESDLIVPRL